MANVLTQFLFSRVGVPKAKAFLDLAAYRHKLISGNIANASTPGYRARDIDFKAEFERLTGEASNLKGTTTHRAHLPTGRNDKRPPEVKLEPAEKGSVNSVDIDREISNLAQNELLFTTGARLLQKKFEGIRNAIKSK
ncbi:MAG: flagellar basal body rod protein FlgB [Candidatus Zixiibacteriota bacterium]|nr:MAG: flagellar basal body rod protein FlgB [candidate division Zixibacteria bacterium]